MRLPNLRALLARLLLADPQVVILDEATSALDQATEAKIHATLRRRLAGRTMLIVAHRLTETPFVKRSGQVVAIQPQGRGLSHQGVDIAQVEAVAVAGGRKPPDTVRFR